jgi:hypothetical protein
MDALDNPVDLLAGPGQQNDMAQAHDLSVGLSRRTCHRRPRLRRLQLNGHYI